MSKEFVRNLITKNFGLAECSTVSLTAILNSKPEQLTLEAIYKNTSSLMEMVSLTTYELLKQEIGIFVRVMDDHMKPSQFFRSTVRPLLHGKKIAAFIGGYMITKGSLGVEHVVAITSYHEGNRPKVGVCNTNIQGSSRRIYKREPLDWLDLNIHDNDGVYRERAVALIGTRIDLSDKQTVDHIKQTQNDLREFRERMLQRKK